MNYNLSHLDQHEAQDVIGPVQDDEALLLYAFIRVTLCKNIVELGFQTGYSARNFLAAVGAEGAVVSIDVGQISQLATNHFGIVKNAKDITPEELPFDCIDLVFYDTHDYDATIAFHNTMYGCGKINENTTIVLHDTGLHHKSIIGGVEIDGGWAHQIVERNVNNFLMDSGWNAIHAHGIFKNFHPERGPAYRHGLTILQKDTRLKK